MLTGRSEGPGRTSFFPSPTQFAPACSPRHPLSASASSTATPRSTRRIFATCGSRRRARCGPSAARSLMRGRNRTRRIGLSRRRRRSLRHRIRGSGDHGPLSRPDLLGDGGLDRLRSRPRRPLQRRTFSRPVSGHGRLVRGCHIFTQSRDNACDESQFDNPHRTGIDSYCLVVLSGAYRRRDSEPSY